MIKKIILFKKKYFILFKKLMEKGRL